MSHTEQMRDALQTGLEYAEQVLIEHDLMYKRHPATESSRDVIIADISELERALAALTAPAAEVPEAMGDAAARKVLLASDLYDMHKHVGWYSAPEKNFKEKGVALILSVASARDAQWQSTRLRGGVPEASIEIDFKQATELLEMFGGEPSLVTLMPGDGHSGKGLYAYWTDIPGEGAIFLGVTDDEAAPQAPALDAGVVRDAERYRIVRRGQHWSTINGIGDVVRGEALDADADAKIAALSAQAGKGGA